MSFFVYILKLTDGCYYVGRTGFSNLQSRIYAHKNKNGSAWTSLHHVVSVLCAYETDDVFKEDCETKRLMLKYGIHKVRGGAYSTIHLPDFQLRALEYELRSCSQLCYRCGSNTHFVSNCPN